ncbi:YraN family protein [Streptomyces tubercidicus]|nr:YraN family protein [Streptomyces tubercidicus]
MNAMQAGRQAGNNAPSTETLSSTRSARDRNAARVASSTSERDAALGSGSASGEREGLRTLPSSGRGETPSASGRGEVLGASSTSGSDAARSGSGPVGKPMRGTGSGQPAKVSPSGSRKGGAPPPGRKPPAAERIATEPPGTDPSPRDSGPTAAKPADTRRRALGRYGEDLAARRLIEAGMRILDRNWRCRDGEIDIVAADGDALVVCEVKTRRAGWYEHPMAAVRPEKTARLRLLAERWLERHGGPPPGGVRIDVIGVLLPARGAPVVQHARGVA